MAETPALRELRWRPDQVVTNHFGQRVWLRERFQGEQQIGITDCCFADDPCEWHAAFPAPPAEPADKEEKHG